MFVPSNTPLYQSDQAIRKYETTLKKIQALSDLDEADRALFTKAEDATHAITTEETIFHPQGGGQPSDRGTMMAAEHSQVFHVSLARQAVSVQDTIIHVGHFAPDTLTSDHFRSSRPVEQQVDSALRDLHSRIHTAGHLIGFAVHALREQIGPVGEGKASHYPDMAFVEFVGKIGGEHKDAIQAKVDEYVALGANIDIKFLSRDDAVAQSTAVPDVIKSDSEGWVRVMAVEGLGAYPCGGTHLPTTKDLGKVEVKKISRKKDITKISYNVS